MKGGELYECSFVLRVDRIFCIVLSEGHDIGQHLSHSFQKEEYITINKDRYMGIFEVTVQILFAQCQENEIDFQKDASNRRV